MDLEGQYGRRYTPARGTRPPRPRARTDAGYAMAALLVAIAIMGVGWATLVPVWKHATQREKEEELIFRAGQYARAIALYQRRYANAFPPNIDVLLKGKFLRKQYKDPITGGDFRVLSSLELQSAGGFSTRPGLPTGAQQRPGLSSGGVPPAGGVGTAAGTSGSGPSGRLTDGSPRQPGLPSRPGGPGREVTANVAAVVSRSTATSIKVFKNRQQYNQWIVTVEDVTPRRGPQPVQPGQQPGRPGFPSRPGSGPGATPGLGGSGVPTIRPPG